MPVYSQKPLEYDKSQGYSKTKSPPISSTSKPMDLHPPKLEQKGSKKFDQFISMKDSIKNHRTPDMPHPTKPKKKSKNKKNTWAK